MPDPKYSRENYGGCPECPHERGSHCHQGHAPVCHARDCGCAYRFAVTMKGIQDEVDAG